MNDVSLSRLTHDIVQNIYKDLHALLDSLGDASPSERRNRLIDYVLKSRHRLARLLVSVRWFMSYSAFHGSAQMTRQMASSRSDVYTYDADSLFHVSQAAKAASSLPSALAEAAEILGPTGLLRRIPRIIESSIGLDIHAISPKAPSTAKARTGTTESVAATKDKTGNAILDNTNSSSSDDDSNGGSTDENDEDITNEAIGRLRATVLRVVVDNLPRGVRLLDSGADGKDVAVRIGVPKVWNVDVVLEGLKEEAKALRVLTQEIIIDGHPDAPTGMHYRRKARDAKERALPLCQAQSMPLRSLINDRMYFTALSLPDEMSETERIKRALRTLAITMSLECSAGMAMAHIRSQAGALVTSRAWKEGGLTVTGRWQEERQKVPKCTLSYWPRSHLRASVSFGTANIQNLDLLNSEEDGKAIARIIDVKHSPQIPGRGSNIELSLESIDLQGVLLQSGRLRAHNELVPIAIRCNNEFEEYDISASVISSGKTCESIVVKFGHSAGAVVFNMSLTSGGLSVTPRGFLASELEAKREVAQPALQMIWKGERFFVRSEAIWSLVKSIVKACSKVAELGAVIRGVLGSGGDVFSTWPPGVANVGNGSVTEDGVTIIPPFTTAERKRPRAFVSLANLAQMNASGKRRRVDDNVSQVPATPSIATRRGTDNLVPGSKTLKRGREAATISDLTTSPKRRRREGDCHFGLEHKNADGMIFFEGRFLDSASTSPMESESNEMTAGKMVGLCEVRYDAECRLKRELLLGTLMKSAVISSWDADGNDWEHSGSCEVAVTLRTLPMEVDKAVVQFRKDDEWRLRLKLRRDIFDDTGFENCGASYRKLSHILQFCYASPSKQCVRSCAREMIRARTAATLILSLKEDEKRYKVLEKRPSHVLVECGGRRWMIGFGYNSVEVEVHPKSEFLRVEIIPYMEEILLECRRDMGRMLAMMLKTTVPMAVAMEAAIRTLSHTKWRFRSASVFRGRLIVVNRSAKDGSVAYGVDVDGQMGNGKVIVCDVERVRKSREVNDKGSSSQSSGGTSCILVWEEILENLVKKKLGSSVSNGMGMEIDISLLYPVLKLIFQSVTSKAPPSINVNNE